MRPPPAGDAAALPGRRRRGGRHRRHAPGKPARLGAREHLANAASSATKPSAEPPDSVSSRPIRGRFGHAEPHDGVARRLVDEAARRAARIFSGWHNSVITMLHKRYERVLTTMLRRSYK